MIPLETLVEITRLKQLDRAGWVRRGVTTPESVAAHSWGVTWLVLALAPPTLDRARCLTYATLHDLAEVRVGDLTPEDNVSSAEKHDRERRAIDSLLATRPDLRAAVADYEAQRDPEARYVRQLDRIDMALQALAYHRAGHARMREFATSARSAVVEPILVSLLDAIDAALETPA